MTKYWPLESGVREFFLPVFLVRKILSDTLLSHLKIDTQVQKYIWYHFFYNCDCQNSTERILRNWSNSQRKKRKTGKLGTKQNYLSAQDIPEIEPIVDSGPMGFRFSLKVSWSHKKRKDISTIKTMSICCW